MSHRKKGTPTEPVAIPDLFVTAVALDGTAEYVRLTGRVAHSSAPATGRAEQRIVARLVMPASTARDLHHALGRALRRGNGN